MGRFRDNDRRGGFRGERGGRFNDRESSFGNRRNFRDSGRPQMFDATCSKCGRACQVPFRPTGSKPVLCSECFGGKSRDGPRHDDHPHPHPHHHPHGPAGGPGISHEQFRELNEKLDKILAVLSQLEFEELEDEEADEDSDDDDFDDEE